VLKLKFVAGVIFLCEMLYYLNLTWQYTTNLLLYFWGHKLLYFSTPSY